MTEQAFEDKITLGLPNDVVGPIIPTVLSRIHAVKIELISSIIKTLKNNFLIVKIILLSKEPDLSSGGEILKITALRWLVVPNGKAM